MNNDQKLLFVGALGVVGSFFVGKAAIEGIMEAREKRNFIGPIEQRRQTKLDDAVKFVGTMMSLYYMFQQAPAWIEEASSLMEGK